MYHRRDGESLSSGCQEIKMIPKTTKNVPTRTAPLASSWRIVIAISVLNRGCVDLREPLREAPILAIPVYVSSRMTGISTPTMTNKTSATVETSGIPPVRKTVVQRVMV
jgi:hypothetical protein